jgi:hypothetical protein
MSEWKDLLKADPTQWLLSEGQPWVRYRTMIDLEDRPEGDQEVQAARQAMLQHPMIQSLMEELGGWPGYPLKRHNNSMHSLHKLTVLADFGLQATDPVMPSIIKDVMAHQSPEGAFQVTMQIDPRYGGSGETEWNWMLCDAPVILHALSTFGLGENEAVRKAVHHLTGLIRSNGWPCASKTGFRGPGRKDDPCPLANLLALGALAQMADMRDSEAVHIGAEVLLGHWERQKERKVYLFGIGTDFRKLKYPLIWYDILHVTEVLSRFHFLRSDTRLSEMVDALTAQQDEQGHFTASSVWTAWKGWEFGQKKEPSPWITLMALRVIRRLRG